MLTGRAVAAGSGSASPLSLDLGQTWLVQGSVSHISQFSDTPAKSCLYAPTWRHDVCWFVIGPFVDMIKNIFK